jgi:hypothetical protein
MVEGCATERFEGTVAVTQEFCSASIEAEDKSQDIPSEGCKTKGLCTESFKVALIAEIGPTRTRAHTYRLQ